MITDKRIEYVFFGLLIIGAVFLSYFILRPYLGALFIALVLALICRPVYERIHKFFRGRGSVASLLTIVIATVAILVPVIVFGIFLFEDARNLYFRLIDGGGATYLAGLSEILGRTFGDYIPTERLDITSGVSRLLGSIFDNLDNLFSGIFKTLVSFFIMAVALFYLLRDGKKLRERLIFLSPLADSYDESIANRVERAITSVVRGSLLVALAQGMLSAVGFAIFGVSNPVLFGSLAAVTSLVPSIGTAIVIVPAVIYLFLQGMTIQAIGLFAWGAVVVGLADNLLRPVLIERGLHIHPFLILLSVIGGLSYFGAVGFVAGPVVLALLIALLEIYQTMAKRNSLPPESATG